MIASGIQVDCTTKFNAETRPSNCVLNLQILVEHFTSVPDENITSLRILGLHTAQYENRLEVFFQPSRELFASPPNVSTIVAKNLRCSWNSISTLTQHFRVVNGYFPKNVDSEDVYSDLSLIVNFKTQGVNLLGWSPIVEDLGQTNTMSQQLSSKGREMIHDEQTKSTRSLLSLPGMEEVRSLVLVHGTMEESFMELPPVKMNNMFVSQYTSLIVLQGYHWPELRYLELEQTSFSLEDILLLNNSIPQLSYLKLYIPFQNIPEAVWTFDWDTLPWKTGFVAVYIKPLRLCDEVVELNLKAKIISGKIPQIHFYDANERNPFCNGYLRKQLDVDFSMNELNLLGFFQFTFHDSFYISLNLSHNILTSVDIFTRFHVSRNANYPQVSTLDPSYNKLNDSVTYNSDFLLIRSLTELYLNHNKYQDFPKYLTEIEDRQYQFDMSYNYLENPNINFDEISYMDFSSLREIYFKHNLLTEIPDITTPDITYRATFLEHGDFSYNKITFRSVWPSTIDIKPATEQKTMLSLQFNLIAEMDLPKLKAKSN